MDVVKGNMYYKIDLLRIILYFLLTLLVAGYLLQLFSPLRVNTDSYRLLSMAISAETGQGYLVDGHSDQYPIGYPFLIKTLLHYGLGSSMVLIFLNLLCLGISLTILFLWARTLELHQFTALPVAIVLASWVMVKHVSIPLTEFLYLGLSTVSIYLVWIFFRKSGYIKWAWFILSGIFAYLALRCRTVGLTILPVLLFSALFHQDIAPASRRLIKKKKYIPLLFGGFAVVLFLVFLAMSKTGWYQEQFVQHQSYFSSFVASIHHEGIPTFFLRNVKYHVLEIGEIILNLPADRVPSLIPLFYLAGIIGWIGLFQGAYLLFHSKNLFPLSVYFIIYACLICVWPYYDVRFWLPQLPLFSIMFLITYQKALRSLPKVKIGIQSYLVCFFLIGILSLAFSTRISLSGKDFSELYGDGTNKMTYRYAFNNGRKVDLSQVDFKKVRLLKIFEPLARPDQ